MMNTETLRGLLVDRELGELPPDVTELLDAYVEVAPTARAEAEATARTVSTTRNAVRRYPDLVPAAEAKVIPVFLWLMRAAAAIVIAASMVWFVYRAGKTQPTVVENRVHGVWAEYQVAYDSHRGGYVVTRQD